MDKTPTVIAYANALREWSEAGQPTDVNHPLTAALDKAERALTSEERSRLTFIAPEVIIATFASAEALPRVDPISTVTKLPGGYSLQHAPKFASEEPPPTTRVKREPRHAAFYMPPETLMLGEAQNLDDVRALSLARYGESWEKYVLLAFLDMNNYYHRERATKRARVTVAFATITLLAQCVAMYFYLHR